MDRLPGSRGERASCLAAGIHIFTSRALDPAHTGTATAWTEQPQTGMGTNAVEKSSPFERVHALRPARTHHRIAMTIVKVLFVNVVLAIL